MRSPPATLSSIHCISLSSRSFKFDRKFLLKLPISCASSRGRIAYEASPMYLNASHIAPATLQVSSLTSCSMSYLREMPLRATSSPWKDSNTRLYEHTNARVPSVLLGYIELRASPTFRALAKRYQPETIIARDRAG